MEILPAVEPCSTEYCFMSRDGVLEGVRGNVFAAANYMMGLVARQDDRYCDFFRRQAAGVNTIDCANSKGVCPRFEAIKEPLKALGGYELLDEALTAERQQGQPLPKVYVDAEKVYVTPLSNAEN